VSDLRLDTARLDAWSVTVRSIVRDLHTAGHQADSAAHAVGHAALAGTVRDFAEGWQLHRARTVDELTGMADALDAVNETFTDLDSRVAASLTRAAKA